MDPSTTSDSNHAADEKRCFSSPIVGGIIQQHVSLIAPPTPRPQLTLTSPFLPEPACEEATICLKIIITKICSNHSSITWQWEGERENMFWDWGKSRNKMISVQRAGWQHGMKGYEVQVSDFISPLLFAKGINLRRDFSSGLFFLMKDR